MINVAAIRMQVSARDAEDLVLYQLAAVAGVASVEGLRLQHVKPHGALFNMKSAPGLASDISASFT